MESNAVSGTTAHASPSDSIIYGIEQIGPLEESEKRLFSSKEFVTRNTGPHAELIGCQSPELNSLPHCTFLIDGFAYSYKLMETGQRQIVAFHTPGSFCDLSSVHLGPSDITIAAATSTTIAFVPNDWLLHESARHAGLGHLLSRMILIETSVSREWLVNVGRRSAYLRTAHLLCELATRIRAAGLAAGRDYPLPLTPLHLADALGLTPVHLSRTLQWLRDESLIELTNGRLTIPNWDELAQAADFDPGYLHLGAARRSDALAGIIPRQA